MLEQGIHLLQRFARMTGCKSGIPAAICRSSSRAQSERNEFVAYVDAIGKLDGDTLRDRLEDHLGRYPEEPEGLLALDPQLVCYSWITGIPNVAFVVFVRKRLVEVQYLRATITQEQRQRIRQMVASTIRQIEAAQFLPPAASAFRRTAAAAALTGTLPGETGHGRCRADPPPRSRKPWLA